MYMPVDMGPWGSWGPGVAREGLEGPGEGLEGVFSGTPQGGEKCHMSFFEIPGTRHGVRPKVASTCFFSSLIRPHISDLFWRPWEDPPGGPWGPLGHPLWIWHMGLWGSLGAQGPGPGGSGGPGTRQLSPGGIWYVSYVSPGWVLDPREGPRGPQMTQRLLPSSPPLEERRGMNDRRSLSLISSSLSSDRRREKKRYRCNGLSDVAMLCLCPV